MSESAASDLLVAANRSEMNARAVTIILQLQQGMERSRQIWRLRERVRRLEGELAQAREDLAVEEKEAEVERSLIEMAMRQMEEVPLVPVEEAEAK